MKTFQIIKRQSIIDDVPGDITYELIVRDEDNVAFGIKYLTLTTEELRILTQLLIITTRK